VRKRFDLGWRSRLRKAWPCAAWLPLQRVRQSPAAPHRTCVLREPNLQQAGYCRRLHRSRHDRLGPAISRSARC
jgi:hypothetical protein